MLLSDLQRSFDVIGLSEKKIKNKCDLTSNTTIEGEDFVSKLTLTNAGGVGLNIKEGTQFQRQKRLNLNRDPYKNVLCAVTHRQPSGQKLRT